MKASILSLLLIVILFLLLRYIVQLLIFKLYSEQEKLENDLILKEEKLYGSFSSDYSNENSSEEVKSDLTKEQVSQSNLENKKVVLSMVNDKESSSKKQITNYNDIQNLNKKYNKNTYRAKNGRFASVKNTLK